MKSTLHVWILAVVGLLFMAAPALAATGSITGKVKARPRKYARNVVVYVDDAPGNTKPRQAVMDQKNLTFIPNVLPVTRGSTVKFLNSDSVRHNVFSPDHEKYNLGTWPTGKAKSKTFKRLGAYTQLCNVHPEMEAFVVVLKNGYFGVTDRKGNFTIKGVPAGTFTLKTWGKKLKPTTQKVTVQAGKATSVELKLRR